MPLREWGCEDCRAIIEMYNPSINPDTLEKPPCPRCSQPMNLLISAPIIDSSSTFNKRGGGAFTYQGLTGLYHEIDSLHKLRQVEHAYLESKHDVRFDAWSANENNPDPIDGFGPEHWSGDPHSTTGRVFSKW